VYRLGQRHDAGYQCRERYDGYEADYRSQ